jgi:benzoyl-CoA reductase subunit D
MITAGIDCGARYTKTVILNSGEITCRAAVLTGFDPPRAVEASLDRALKIGGIRIEDLAGTGLTGGDVVPLETPHNRVDEVRALGRGGVYHFPGARTVVDVGAEEGRAVRIDAGGAVKDSARNERCAAGAGIFLESMSSLLETPLEDMGPLALTSENAIPMNAQCVVFAESEVVSLIHSGAEKREILRAVHEALAGRVVSTIRRIGFSEEVVVAGGMAYNPAFVEIVKRELGLSDLRIPPHPEYAASLGAAVVAAEECRQA